MHKYIYEIIDSVLSEALTLMSCILEKCVLSHFVNPLPLAAFAGFI